ncbi:MAG: hypothetical protein KDA58_16645 [Planctomycetaceae bacterium]|nr:hypothetical protein [Planctomycetaceae bacterium]
MDRHSPLLQMFCLALVLGLGTVAPADSLQGVREQVRDKQPRPSAPKKEKHRHHHHDCDDDDGSDFWVSIVGPPVFWVTTSPWWVPASALGDDYSADGADFLSYPYQYDRGGWISLSGEPPPDFDGVGMWFSSEYGTDFSGLQRAGQRLRIDTGSRFGLDTEFNTWIEDIPAGHDTLFTGDANLVYRFAQSESWQWYSGLGMNWLSEDHFSEFGFNFTYGATFTPAKPFVFETTFDLGTLGDASLFHLHSTGGVVWKHLELFGGYDYLRIGNQDLHGPLIGARIWW